MIPFYLQLIASPKSLQAFLYPTLPNHSKLKRSKSNADEPATPPTVRVYLMRQVTVVLKGIPSIRKFAIGEGTLRSLPPGAPMAPLLRSQPLDVGLSTLDYEGEVRANSDVTVGQFVMSRIQVRVRLMLLIESLLSHAAGLHDGLPCTTEPIRDTAKFLSALSPYPSRHRHFYGLCRPRRSCLMIFMYSTRYLTTVLYQSILSIITLVSICALVALSYLR
jgi:hypothetical protein